jgi:predicted DNA binding protein
MYVEYYHESEILRETLREFSDLKVEVRNIAAGTETPLQLTCAVTGTECGAFGDAASREPAVDELKLLEDGELRRLYWLRAVPGTIDQRAYEAAVDSGGFYLQSRHVEGGWCTTMNYPDQACFREFQRRISAEGMEIEPTVIRVGQYLLSGGAFELTEKQEAVLSVAVEEGYFDVPRGTTLSQVADRIGISEQAASERLRRAMDSLASAAVTSYTETERVPEETG